MLLLVLLGMALGEEEPRPFPGEAVLLRCGEVVRGLEVLALYREGRATLVLLGRETPLLLLALEGERPYPHLGPPRGRRFPSGPFPS